MSCVKLAGIFSKYLYSSQSNQNWRTLLLRPAALWCSRYHLRSSVACPQPSSGQQQPLTQPRCSSDLEQPDDNMDVCNTEYSYPPTPTEHRQKAAHHVVSNELMTRGGNNTNPWTKMRGQHPSCRGPVSAVPKCTGGRHHYRHCDVTGPDQSKPP